MKKVLLSFICLSVATTFLLISCQKSSDAARTTTTTCTDSAYLMPDSLLGCSSAAMSNYKMFYLTKSRKDILVPRGTFTDIDTIVNGADFLINYDSVGTVAFCGAVLTKVNLTCHTKL